MQKNKNKYLYVKRWRENNPERVRAQRIIFVGVRNGSIKKKPCRVCGKEKVEAHHDDYSQPYKIMWLCKEHHSERDIQRRKKEERMAKNMAKMEFSPVIN